MSAAPGAVPPGTKAPADADEYRSLGVVTFPMGEDRELVFAEPSGAAKVLSLAEVDVLTSCGTFRPLETHANEICRTSGLPPDQQLQILYQLAQFARAGLLVSRKQVLDLLRPPSPPRPAPPRIAALGVVTRDRPESLERCLEGAIRNAKTHGRACEFIVMDDSGDDRTRAVLQGLKARHGATIRHAGRREKDLYAAALAKEAGVDPETLAFALADPEGCGFTPGANRNALLLDTVGEMFVSLDDDTLGTPCAPPMTPSPGLMLTSEADLTESWFHPDRDSALRAAPPVEKDLLGLHEELLGRDPASAAAGTADFGTIDARFLRRLRAGDGRVALTQMGTAGDSALGSHGSFLSLGGPSRDRLLASEAAYRAALSSREVVRAVNRLTVTHRPHLMTTAAGFDNRSLLPPFMPVTRNEDGVFALTLRKCSETALFGTLPWVIPHVPPTGRAMLPDAVTRLDFNDILVSCLSSLEPGFFKPEGADRFALMGRHIAELAGLPAREFRNFLLRIDWLRLSRGIQGLERQIAHFKGEPAWWAADVQKLIDQSRQALTGGDHIVPLDLSGGRDAAAAGALAQRLVARFGRLLEAWPALVAAARTLRARGIRLSSPL